MGKPPVQWGTRLAGRNSPQRSCHDFQWGNPSLFMSTTKTGLASLNLQMSTYFIFCLKISVPKQTKPDVQPTMRQQHEDEHMAFQFLHPINSGNPPSLLTSFVSICTLHYVRTPLNITTPTPLQGYVSFSTRKLTCQRLLFEKVLILRNLAQ